MLAAQAFDARTLKLSGDPIPLEDEPTAILDPSISFTAGRATSISRTGSLAYYSSPSLNTTPAWYDANGVTEGQARCAAGTLRDDQHFAGRDARDLRAVHLAVRIGALAGRPGEGRGGPLSSGPGRNDTPIWSPDGKRVVFAADRDGPQQIYVKAIDDPAPEQPLYRSDVPFKGPNAWSPDGRWIVLTQLDPATAQNVYRLPAAGGELTPIVKGPTRDNAGLTSPDGRWFVYYSDETGRFEAYVQPFPDAGRRVQVSQQGAAQAWWTRDGRQLLLLGADLHTLWRVEVETGATFRAGVPKQIATFPSSILWMDAMPDRQRFLAMAPERTGVGSMTVVQHWQAALAAGRK